MNEIDKSFWKGKNVFITGHTGFKGSWLSIYLLSLGANVKGFALEPYTNKDNYVLSGLSNKIDETIGTICNNELIEKAMIKAKPDIVFHLAAQPLVRLSYEIPRETYETNVMGTLNVLEAIRKTDSCKAGVIITSDKCYENKEQIWGYRESDPMGGFDPYSSSKGCCELLVSSYNNSFMKKEGKNIASLRAGNVIGGGDWALNRIIPDCIRALEKDLPIEIRSPKSLRPWQHVLEPLSGYIQIAERLFNDEKSFCGGWNFGPDTESIVPVENIADLVIKFWGSGKWEDVSKEENVLHEAKLLSLDCTKAKTYLKWKPRLNIEKAIKYTIDWYKNYKDINVYDYCIKQIKDFENEI